MLGCDFAEIRCVFDKCPAKVLKSKLAEHLDKECSQRRAQCNYCNEEMPFADLEVHAATVMLFYLTIFFSHVLLSVTR